MTTDIDAALAELGLDRADLPAAVADTVARHLEDNEPDRKVVRDPDGRVSAAVRVERTTPS